MTKILFTSRPAYGHLYPMMPLAEAARDAGHEVVFATGETFVPKLEALGFETHPAGLSIEEGRDRMLELHGVGAMPRDETGRPNLEWGAKLFLDVLAPHAAADLQPLLEQLAPDIVIYEQGEFGGAVAAAAAGLPAVCHAISPRMPAQVVDLFRNVSRLDELWERYGFSTPPLDVFLGDLHVDPIPASLQPDWFLSEQARIPVRPIA